MTEEEFQTITSSKLDRIEELLEKLENNQKKFISNQEKFISNQVKLANGQDKFDLGIETYPKFSQQIVNLAFGMLLLVLLTIIIPEIFNR